MVHGDGLDPPTLGIAGLLGEVGEGLLGGVEDADVGLPGSYLRGDVTLAERSRVPAVGIEGRHSPGEAIAHDLV